MMLELATLQVNEMQTSQASSDLRDAVHGIISNQMAEALLERRADLGDIETCRADLLAHGFGRASVSHLTARAIVIASTGTVRR